DVHINIFLQSWKTYLKGQSQITELKQLTSTAKKYGLRIKGIAFSRNILWTMPIWYHKEANQKIRTMNHTTASICLRSKHGIRTVGDAESMANLAQSNDHSPVALCECDECEFIQETYACENPRDCARQAVKLLDTLPPKWDPRCELPEDYQGPPGVNSNRAENIIPFDNWITVGGTLGNIFQIFTDKTSPTTNTLSNLKPIATTGQLKVTIDGACKNEGEEDAKARAAVFISNGHPDNRVAKLPKYLD
ncbi:hypothetical protein BT96DRAFT_843115, partial [Gymnopus androsaceus JB14]